ARKRHQARADRRWLTADRWPLKGVPASIPVRPDWAALSGAADLRITASGMARWRLRLSAVGRPAGCPYAGRDNQSFGLLSIDQLIISGHDQRRGDRSVHR